MQMDQQSANSELPGHMDRSVAAFWSRPVRLMRTLNQAAPDEIRLMAGYQPKQMDPYPIWLHRPLPF